MSRTYSYSNAYSDISPGTVPINTVLANRCFDANQTCQFIQNAAVAFRNPGFVLQCVDKNNHRTNIEVFGYRHSFLLMLKENAFCRRFNFSTVSSTLRQLSQFKPVDGKVVVGRFQEGACEGLSVFIRVYFDRRVSSYERGEIRRLLTTDAYLRELYRPLIVDHSAQTYNRWLLSNGAVKHVQDATTGYTYREMTAFTAGKVKVSEGLGYVKHESAGTEMGTTTIQTHYSDLRLRPAQTIPMTAELEREIFAACRPTNAEVATMYPTEQVDYPLEDTPKRVTFKQLKRRYLTMPLTIGGAYSIHCDRVEFTSMVIERTGNLTTTLTDVERIHRECLLHAARVREVLRDVWLLRADGRCAVTRQKTMEKIANERRYLAYDIETNFAPHVKKLERITCVGSVNFCNQTPDPKARYDVFALIAPNRHDDDTVSDATDVGSREVAAECRRLVSEGNDFVNELNLSIDPQHVTVRWYNDELTMLNAFFAHVHAINPSAILGYNSNAYDTPMVLLRHQTLCDKKGELRLRPSPRTFVDRFTRRTRSSINVVKAQYRSNKKGAKKTLDVFTDKLPQPNQRKDGFSRTNLIPDTDAIHGIIKNVTVLTSDNVAHVDAFRKLDPSGKGTTLKKAAASSLNLNKLEADCVKYENLNRTFTEGTTRETTQLLAYCLNDALLVVLLALRHTFCSQNTMMAIQTGLFSREVFPDQNVALVFAMFKRFGWQYKLLNIDTDLAANDEKLLQLDFKYVDEEHHECLPARAGMAVPNKKEFRGICGTCDANAQYPNIMIGRNVCLTTKLTARAAKRKIGGRTTVVNLPNIRRYIESKNHQCTARCTQNKHRRRMCNYRIKTKKTNNAIYFRADWKSIASRMESCLLTERKSIKAAMAVALRNGNHQLYRVLNSGQLSVKLLANSVNGIFQRYAPTVGGCITSYGRDDTINSAQRLKDLFGETVVTGDTDSIFITLVPPEVVQRGFSAICEYLGLPPRSLPSAVYDALFAKFNAYVELLNKGSENCDPVFPKPSRMEVEKIFLNLTLLKKKNYAGSKLVPGDKAIHFHRSGMHQGNAAWLKSKFTMSVVKMLATDDVDGMMQFTSDTHLLCSHEIRTEEILRATEDEITNTQDRGARERYLRGGKAALKRKYNAGVFPLDKLLSDEKVGSCAVPTPAMKRARTLRYIDGKPPNLRTTVCRPVEVQLTSFADEIQKLTRPDNEYRSSAGDGESERLDITQMPQHLINRDSFSLSPAQCDTFAKLIAN